MTTSSLSIGMRTTLAVKDVQLTDRQMFEEVSSLMARRIDEKLQELVQNLLSAQPTKLDGQTLTLDTISRLMTLMVGPSRCSLVPHQVVIPNGQPRFHFSFQPSCALRWTLDLSQLS